MQRPAKLALALCSIALMTTLSLGAALAAQDEHRKRMIEFVAWSDDSSQYLIKVADENIGTVLEVRGTKKGDLVKAYPYMPDEEKRKIARVRKKHEMTQDPHEDPTHPRKDLILMTSARGKKLVVYMMKGERIKKYTDFELIQDKKGKPAKASVKQAVWDQKGKHVVLISHQKLDGKRGFVFEGDFVHSFKFKSYKVKFDDADE